MSTYNPDRNFMSWHINPMPGTLRNSPVLRPPEGAKLYQNGEVMSGTSSEVKCLVGDVLESGKGKALHFSKHRGNNIARQKEFDLIGQ